MTDNNQPDSARLPYSARIGAYVDAALAFSTHNLQNCSHAALATARSQSSLTTRCVHLRLRSVQQAAQPRLQACNEGPLTCAGEGACLYQGEYSSRSSLTPE